MSSFRPHKDLSSTLKRYGLGEGDAILCRQVSYGHSQEIAVAHCRQWMWLPVRLDMENPQIVKEDIEREYQGARERTQRFFNAWREQKGKEATYKVLINALLHINRKADAEFVCQLLEDFSGEDPQDSEKGIMHV